MLQNYLTTALRNLLKHKTNNALNISGLALGLTCCLLISVFVRSELSYDSYEGSEKIYRITEEGFGENGKHWAPVSPALGPSILESMSGIDQMGRLSYINTRVLSSFDHPDVKFEEKGGYYADNAVLNLFRFKLKKGNVENALSEINTVVVTESMAKKYFAGGEVLGKTLILTDGNGDQALLITGVIEDIPYNTHLEFDYLVSMSTFAARIDDAINSTSWKAFYTYVRLGDKTSISDMEAKLPGFMDKFYASPNTSTEEILASGTFHFQPVADIHLHSNLEKEMAPNGDIKYVYIFSSAAFMILIIACINFINISTVQALKRIREVGVRKAIGANRKELIWQFLTETILQTVGAVIIALLFFRLASPYYEFLTGEDILFKELISPFYLFILTGVIAVVSLSAGLYPAFFASGFETVNALKGKTNSVFSVGMIRRGLITLQFAVSVFLIAGTIIIYQQMRLFRNSNLGFEKEQVIAVKLLGEMKTLTANNPDLIKARISGHSSVSVAALASRLPGERLGTDQVNLVDQSRNITSASMRCLWADETFLQALQISLLQGRNFLPNLRDTSAAYILNEAGVKALGLADPIGEKVRFQDAEGSIVGVIRDYNFASLHSAVEPLIIKYDPSSAGYLLLKVNGREAANLIPFVRSKTKEISQSSLFSYSFLDDNLAALYASEERVENVFKVFSVFALLISCFGLFGLASYTTRLRIREMGIRRVLGATQRSLVSLLAMDFLRLVIVAFLIASPLTWWLMSRWLENFAYKVEIRWWVFVLTGSMAVIIAFATVGVQALRAALMNPVKSLRSE